MYNQPSGTVPPPSGVVYTATSRGGIWIGPDIYTFVSGSVDKRDWNTTSLNSSGFRTLLGLLGSVRLASWRNLWRLSARGLRFDGNRHGQQFSIWRPP